MTGDEKAILEERIAELQGVPVEEVRARKPVPVGPDHLPQDVEDWAVSFRRYRGIATDLAEKSLAYYTEKNVSMGDGLMQRARDIAVIAELWRQP